VPGAAKGDKEWVHYRASPSGPLKFKRFVLMASCDLQLWLHVLYAAIITKYTAIVLQLFGSPFLQVCTYFEVRCLHPSKQLKPG